jgi:L-2,4-diaminobutyric acid acetyltransferase
MYALIIKCITFVLYATFTDASFIAMHTINKRKGILIHFKTPTLEDSSAVYELVDRCKPLDLNSRYCYMLVCTHFQDTSVVTEENGQISGLVSAYLDPKQPETLFVWQVAVDASLRGQGVALRMLKSILERPNLRHVRFIETTISPSNTASQSLFKRLAAELKAEITDRPYFDKALFGGEAHEDEYLYRIGPFPNQ